MFALEPGQAGAALRALGERVGRPSAVLVVSPHWMTPGLRVTASALPDTIHDFGGFPPELYRLQYTVPGHPALANEIAGLLHAQGLPAQLDPLRGLDHGAWVPLLHLYSQRDVPVIQLSLPQALDAHAAYRLGLALAPLRDHDVMLIGSGSLTHNLHEVFRGKDVDGAYAHEFAHWARAAVQGREVDALLDYRRRAPHAERAHPTEEHFLPLLVALGASTSDDTVSVIDGGISDGVMSMDGFVWEAA
ncbi:MAG: dioxygenase [Chiayiivirga sp.]|nr:dioxygenase [Chiayiivirga sp.]